jgi:LssY-like putative type I secretion system component LssY
MIRYSIWWTKRFAVLLPGVIIAYLSVRDIFPYIHHRLHYGGLAVLVTYALAAYALIPALIRLWRIIWPPQHLPHYCVTPDGFASDPLNVGIIATRLELIQAMEKAGWQLADRHTVRNMVRAITYVIIGRVYETAPMSSMYLFGRKQDLSFEQFEKDKSTRRHHVRFWATTYSDKTPLSVRAISWQHRRTHVQGDNLLWVGAASLDTGVALIRHNLQFSHMIHPDTNREREMIVGQLRDAKLVSKLDSVRLGRPYRLVNRVWNGSLHADGQMAIVHLKQKS